MGYICSKCHYKHDKKEKNDKIPDKCPYCSGIGTLKKNQSAQELLDNIYDEIDIVDQSRKQRTGK